MSSSNARTACPSADCVPHARFAGAPTLHRHGALDLATTNSCGYGVWGALACSRAPVRSEVQPGRLATSLPGNGVTPFYSAVCRSVVYVT